MSNQLHFLKLDSFENIAKYKEVLKSLNCDSPYYMFELVNAGYNVDSEALCCFIFVYEASPVVIMPFILREVQSYNDQTYFDVTSPWGYNGPFCKKDLQKSVLSEFWQHADKWYLENNVVSEFVRFGFDGNQINYSGKVVHTLFNVKGDITDWEKFWGNLKSNTRNQFRKAEKSGLQFEIHFEEISNKKIEEFYKVYIGTMDRRDAIDSFYHHLDYFEKVCHENSGKCAIGLVYFENKPISTEFFLVSDDTMYSFLGGTDSEFFKSRPNEFLKISAVKWAGEKGLKYYMIGGGLSNGKDDKLYLYKKKYFAYDDDIDFYTGRKIVNVSAYKSLVEKLEVDFEEEKFLESIEEGFFPKYRQKK